MCLVFPSIKPKKNPCSCVTSPDTDRIQSQLRAKQLLLGMPNKNKNAPPWLMLAVVPPSYFYCSVEHLSYFTQICYGVVTMLVGSTTSCSPHPHTPTTSWQDVQNAGWVWRLVGTVPNKCGIRNYFSYICIIGMYYFFDSHYIEKYSINRRSSSILLFSLFFFRI